MRTTVLLIFTVLFSSTPRLAAQSKAEMQADIARLTARNDSLSNALSAATTQIASYSRLIDTLSVMTGVHVDDLDTVKTVLELRASARAASADSLARLSAESARLQLALDSLTAAHASCMEQREEAAVPAATASGTTVGKTDQLMKLNGMLEEGLITRDEFLKLKEELMGR